MSEKNSPSTSDKTKIESQTLEEEFKELIESIKDEDFILPLMFGARFNLLSFRKKMNEKVQNKEDIEFLVKMFIQYGNSVKKIMNTPNLSEETLKRFMVLTKKYDIKEKVSGNGREVITLSRIATSFPELVANIFVVNPNISGPITLEEIRLLSDHPEFPSLARESSLACFLPKTHTESLKVLNVFFFAKMMFSEKINQGSASWCMMSKQQRASNTSYYQMKAFNSPLCSEADRKAWCIRLKIMEGNDYSAVWKEAAVKSKAKLTKEYGVTF